MGCGVCGCGLYLEGQHTQAKRHSPTPSPQIQRRHTCEECCAYIQVAVKARGKKVARLASLPHLDGDTFSRHKLVLVLVFTIPRSSTLASWFFVAPAIAAAVVALNPAMADGYHVFFPTTPKNP